MKNYHTRLSLLRAGVVDFGYEGHLFGDGDDPYVYLTDRAAKILDNAYGKDVIERFKKEKLSLPE